MKREPVYLCDSPLLRLLYSFFFFFNDTATTEIYTLSLHDALPISGRVLVRFSAFERFVHWMTATCFIILALSGLNITFGKELLLPLLGPEEIGRAHV